MASIPGVSWRSRLVVAPSKGAGGGGSSGASFRSLRRSDPPPKPTGEAATFLAEVLAGLARQPKSLPAKYMFDDVGLRLFGCLAAAETHYLQRAELSILQAEGPRIAAAIGTGAQLVDLACGDGTRIGVVAGHLREPARLVVADRGRGAAPRVATALGASHPDLPVLAMDAESPWTRVPAFARASRTVAYVPCSLLGELEPRDAKRELARLAGECGPGGGLLLGIDLKKDARELEAAYDDPSGIAASFDLNLLARINRELGGSFQLAAFDHRAVYDATKGRVEMRLVSKRWQWAAVHGHWVNFAASEPITTLVATKYTMEWLTALVASAGWVVDQVLYGEDRKYALVLLGH